MKILNLFILVLFFSLVSCNEWLNVSPEDQIGEKDLFSNGEGFRNALNGIYKSMAEYELYGRQLSWGLPEAMAQTYDYTWATCRSNDLQFTSNYDWTNSHLEPIIDKTWSLDLLDNLECVHQIIAEKRKIHFQYGKYNIHREIEYYDKKRNLIPCQVVYTSERFYLKAVSEDTGEVRNYRIDRMRKILPGEKIAHLPKLPKPEGFSADIFVPEVYEDVQLRVRRVLLDDMIEQLGNYAHVRLDEKDPEHCILVRARMGISYGLYRWIMKYGASMEVLAPESLRKEVAQRIRAAAAVYYSLSVSLYSAQQKTDSISAVRCGILWNDYACPRSFARVS